MTRFSTHRLTLLLITGVLAACAYLVGLMLDLSWLKLVTKPLPILALAIWVAWRGDWRIALGLVAGAIGDVCLLLPKAFLPGMIAFALGHAAYVAAFWSWHRKLVGIALLPVLGYIGLCFALMISGTGLLTIPVAVYMVVIAAMIWRATACVEDTELEPGARWLPLAGAILFAFSDTLIGLNKFVQPIGATFPILLCYWAGQAAIAWAAVRRRGVAVATVSAQGQGTSTRVPRLGKPYSLA